jgi:hypothetical protein
MKTSRTLVMSAIVTVMASLGCHAQLVISSNGFAHFGDTTVVDTTSIVHIAGYGVNGSKGRIAFGNTNNGIATVCVGECPIFTAPNSDKLWLQGSSGLVYTTHNNYILSLKHDPRSPIGFNFYEPVTSRAFYVATDPSLNKESASVTSALSTLANLSAISYRLNGTEAVSSGIINGRWGDGWSIQPGTETDSLHYGLSLTSVLHTLPELVTEDENGVKYVDYNSLIPLLVVAVNELKGQIEVLNSRIEELEDALEGGLEAGSPEEEENHADDTSENEDIIGGLLKPALYQNVPNPFNADTQVRYCLPESVLQANLYIYDLQGKQVKKIPVTERGEAAVTIHGSELQAGMYIYTLIADGQEIDSKRMILTK